MQTLNLPQQQLKHLQRHGVLTVWVPMKEQPRYYRSGVEVPDDSAPCTAVWPTIPYRLGERVEIAYEELQWRDCDCGESVQAMVPVRTHATLTTSPEPRRLDSITEGEAVAAGWHPETTGVPVFSRLLDRWTTVPVAGFACHIKETYPDITPSSYGWLFEITKEG